MSAKIEGTPSGRGVPRVCSIGSLIPRANSATARSARVVTEASTGAKHLLSGVFWSDPGDIGGWAFGSTDPKIPGCPHVGSGEEVYLCMQGRVRVEWKDGSFEFGPGDIIFWPNDGWYRMLVIGDEPAQIFYVMAPPPTSLWGLGDPVSVSGDPVGDGQVG